MLPIGIDLEIITNYCLSNACMSLPQSVFFTIVPCLVLCGGILLYKRSNSKKTAYGSYSSNRRAHQETYISQTLLCFAFARTTPQIQPDFHIAITYESGYKTSYFFLQNTEAECLISVGV